MRLVLGDVPLWSHPAIAADASALDALASDYASQADPPDAARFLFGWLPARAFDAIFGGDDTKPETTLWLFWVSGYEGGVWLRSQLDAANPDSAVGSIRNPATEDAFLAMADDAQAALDARSGGGERLFAYLEDSLWPSGQPGGTGFVSGLVENFGYNQGYLRQILEQPPEGLQTPDAYRIDCSGPIDCRYASPKVAALADLERTARPAVAARAERIMPIQDAAVARGRAVWSSGLSVQGFPQVEYDALLDVSSSYLETVHATALATLGAVEGRDASLGRSAALANAAMNVWLTGYTTGLLAGVAYDPPRLASA